MIVLTPEGWTAKELVDELVVPTPCSVPRLLREHERGTDARLEDGGGRSAIWGCARQLERSDEKPEERCCFSLAHLHASPL